MALAVLVIDRDAALEQSGEPGGVERHLELQVEQRLGLVEQEAAVTVGAGDQRGAGVGVERQRLVRKRFGAAQQLA